MSEIQTIVITSCLTVIGGVIVYAAGHFTVALFVEPIHRLRSLIGDITDSIIYYQNVYLKPQYSKEDENKQAVARFRYLSSKIRALSSQIPWYSFWQFFNIIFKKDNLEEASTMILQLSNSIETHQEGDIEVLKRIEELLRIKIMR